MAFDGESKLARPKLLMVVLTALFIGFLSACGSDSDDILMGDGGRRLQQTVDIPSQATPANTPGSPGVTDIAQKIRVQFNAQSPDLNRARYTRYSLSAQNDLQPDAIVIAVPGFEGGASTFAILADNLMRRARLERNLVLELWAVDRRSNQLEDTRGLDIAEEAGEPEIALDFLFGEELGLALHPSLASSINRRAIFYNTSDDLAFMANWTPLVHSLDIDAIVEKALVAVKSANVYLAGHSAGTGFAARYAATDFALDANASSSPAPGFAKLRGLIFLEGGGGALAQSVPDEAALDLIEARFDGGLFAAVRDQAPRCIDGQTSCSVQTHEADCSAFANVQCVEPVNAFSLLAGLLSPQLLAASEPLSLQAQLEGETAISILQEDQGGIEGNNAVEKLPELVGLKLLLGSAPATATALIGMFLDDDGAVAATASFVSTSVGAPGPVVNGLRTWLGSSELAVQSEFAASVFSNNGPPPTQAQERRFWGTETESSDLEGRLLPIFYQGGTNFSDWYYPSSGLGVTAELGLDSTVLSADPPLGRGRRDIENLTQVASINIPVIAFGASNGLAATSSSFLNFADAIAPCATMACDGHTPRVVSRYQPSEAFPAYGGQAGGFEVTISEGYSHVDIVTADDDEHNRVIGPLIEFIVRHNL